MPRLWLPAGGVLAGREQPKYTVPQVIVGSDEPLRIFNPNSLKFAVIGDSGRWNREQRETASPLAAQRNRFPFDFVLMLGDN